MKNLFSHIRSLFQSREAGRSFADIGERDTLPLRVPRSGTPLPNPSRQRWGTTPTDLLCLQFFTADGTVIEIHEEMPGFDELPDILPDRLPGFPPRSEWYPQVMLPPFAVNRRVVWDFTAH